MVWRHSDGLTSYDVTRKIRFRRNVFFGRRTDLEWMFATVSYQRWYDVIMTRISLNNLQTTTQTTEPQTTGGNPMITTLPMVVGFQKRTTLTLRTDNADPTWGDTEWRVSTAWTVPILTHQVSSASNPQHLSRLVWTPTQHHRQEKKLVLLIWLNGTIHCLGQPCSYLMT